MVRSKQVNFREDENFFNRLKENLPPGISSPSELYRLAARLVYNNPDLLFGLSEIPQSITSAEIEALIDNVLDALKKHDERLDSLRREILALSPQHYAESARKDVAVKIVGELLETPGVFKAKTVAELEEKYKFDFYRDYTPDVLEILSQSGYLKILPGDKILWIKKD